MNLTTNKYMKMMKSISGMTAIVILMALTITCNGCKDDDPATGPGSLAFHIHTLIDANEVENYGELLTTAEGRKITVTTAQLYISNVKLIKTDGSIVDGPSSPILVKQGVEEYEIGDVPEGSYKAVRFDVGLSDATNASVPGPSDLTLYQPSMWFGATTQPDGFVFLNFQGTIDTTDALTGLNLIPFAFKIGTNPHRVTVTMPDQNFNVVPAQQSVVHLEANYAHVLELVDINVASNLSIITAEQNSWLWVSQLEASIGHMFAYE